MLDLVSYYIGWGVIFGLSKLMIQKNVVTYARVPKGPKILVANHPTLSDPFVLFTSMRDRMSIMILYKVFTIPFLGRYLKMAGHIPVVEGNGQDSMDRALGFLHKGVSVLMFIEGG